LIVKSPDALPGFGVMAVEGLFRVDGVKVEELSLDENRGTIRFAAGQFEDGLKSVGRELFEQRAFLGGAVVARSKEAGPVLDDGIFSERGGGLVEDHGEGFGGEKEWEKEEESDEGHAVSLVE